MPAVRNIQTRALMDSWWFCSFHSVSIGSSLLLKILRSFLLCCCVPRNHRTRLRWSHLFSLYLSDAIKASLHNNGRISRRRAINPHSSLSPPTSHHHQVRLPLYRHFSFLHSSGRTRDSSSSSKKVGKIYYSNDSIGTATTTTGSSQQFITNLCFGKKYPALIFSIVFRVGSSPPPAPGLYHFSRLLFLPTCTSTWPPRLSLLCLRCRTMMKFASVNNIIKIRNKNTHTVFGIEDEGLRTKFREVFFLLYSLTSSSSSSLHSFAAAHMYRVTLTIEQLLSLSN